MIAFRQATLDDVDALERVEAESWPTALAAGRDAIASRVAVFPDGQWLATLEGQIVGVAFAQRINGDLLSRSDLTYDTVTDDATFRQTFDANGDVYQLVSVGVNAAGNGRGIGRRLIDRQVQFARSLSGIRRIVGFTRPIQFHQAPELTIEEYVELRLPNGRHQDPVLSFHLDFGAQFVSAHPAFRPEDHEARGYGILIEYPAEPA